MQYKWKCTACELAVDITRPIAECSVPPGEEFACLCPPWQIPQWQRVYEAPALMQASYPDGHRRKGWAELREAAKLEKLAAVSKGDTKSEIKNEIRKLGIKPGKD